MKKHLLRIAIGMTLFLPQLLAAQNSGDLESYIKRLKDDKAGPLTETGYLTAGSDFLYAQEYFDAKNYSSAEWYFMQAVKKQKDNAFASYQLAISLIRQNDQSKRQQAQEYLDAAFRLHPSLKEQFDRDIPSTTTSGIHTPPPAHPRPADNNPGANPPARNNNGANSTKFPGLAAYIERLKYSRSTAGDETSMGTAGREALYGVEHYEAENYDAAETSFFLSLAREASNPYANYLMAVSMAAQGKSKAADPYIQKAIDTDPTLAKSYIKDVAKATTNWQKLVESKKIKTGSPTKKTFGGALVSGDYTCHESGWFGPTKRPPYKGYFELKPGGTYRWLDNGVTGRYKYDAKTGNVTWLSGFFKSSGVKSTQYEIKKEMVQMTINFTDSYSWECGCKK